MLTRIAPVSGTTTFTYTAQGQLETITDPQGKVTRNTYDTLGNLTVVRDPLLHDTHFSYDAMGRRTLVTDLLNHQTQTDYDAMGRVTRVLASDSGETKFTYDPHGQVATVTDPLGRKTLHTYDRFGRAEKVVDPAGGTTTHGYNAMSQPTSLTDAEGHTTAFDYDGEGRLITTTYPTGRVERLTYDAAGRVKTKVDRKNVTTTYLYDLGGRLKKKSYSDGSPDVTFDYDDADRLTQAVNANDTVNRTYDLAGELLTETSTQNGSTVTVDYDTDGRRGTLKLNGGSGPTTIATYGYDDASRLTSITHGAQAFGFTYDVLNRRATMTYPNGIVTSYAYDVANRLAGVSAVDSSQTPLTLTLYTYDLAGNRKTKTTPAFAEAYAYDKLSRLTTADRGDGGLFAWGYDGVGNRTTAQAAGQTVTASYNDRNELQGESAGGHLRVRGRLSEPGTATVAGQPARMLPGDIFEADVTVNPGPNDIPVQATDASGNVRSSTYRVTASGTSDTFVYDLNGNLASHSDGTSTWTYEWTVENQLKRALKDGQELARFSYDPFGRRLQKLAGSTTTAYLYDGNDILQQTSAGSVTRYIHGPGVDEPLAQTDGSGTVAGYFHADGLGSIVAMTSTAGAVTLTRRYDAYGNIEVGATTGGYAFTGREWDPEIGLYYYRARYYDPKVGRFVSEDSVGFQAGVNFYAYALNRPTDLTDPFGHNVYYLIEHGAAMGRGHAAILVGSDGEYTYHSFAGQHLLGMPLPYENAKYDESSFASFQDALQFLKKEGFDEYLEYFTDKTQDEAARAAAKEYGKKKHYNLITDSCQRLTNSALAAAGVDFVGYGDPNLTFERNAPANPRIRIE